MFRVILPQYLNEIIKVEGTDGSTYKDVVINALQQYFSLKEIDQLVITVFTIEGLPLDEQSQMTDKPWRFCWSRQTGGSVTSPTSSASSKVDSVFLRKRDFFSRVSSGQMLTRTE